MERDIFADGMFPVCVATHDQGLRWLFDLSTVLLLLDCRPGDRVLDLGAGPGFASEMLARFGYDVVAVDPDLHWLRHNRGRPAFDQGRIQGTVRVVGGIAEHLPFAPGTFDGVVGLNVMHHVADLPRALGELARVMKPGSVAAFCEPGLDHLTSAETQRAIAEHGEEDRPFDVMAFLRTAKTSGFADALLSATLQPPLRLVPIQEVDLFATGQHHRPHLTARGVVEELHRRHAFAMLVRDGARPRTSRHPGTMTARLAVAGVPAVLARGRAYPVTVDLTNTGDTLWLATPTDRGGYVTLGCKLRSHDGRLVSDALARTPLPRDVAPGESVRVAVSLCVPEAVAAGAHTLSVDAVNELRFWFADLAAAPPPAFAVEVT